MEKVQKQEHNKTVAVVQAINVEIHDNDCRCCGNGRITICESCKEMLHSGYAFMIEVFDWSRKSKKKSTGYVVAFKAAQAYEHGKPGVPMQPGIYFIRETDLKTFLGDGYNRTIKTTEFLSKAPEWNASNKHSKHGHRNHSQRQSANSTRSVTELVSRSAGH